MPLVIAGKHRDVSSPWELPLAGQLLAISAVVVLVIPRSLAVFLNAALFQFISFGWQKLTISVLELISLLPLFKMVR